MIISGGIFELYEYDEFQFLGLDRSGGTGGRLKYNKSEKKEEHRESTMRKAKITIKRLVSSNIGTFSKFITLTFKEDVKCLKTANYEFKKFKQRLNYQLEINLKYLCVPEFTKQGRVHYHVIMFNLPYIKSNDLSDIWENGFIKINKIKSYRNIGSYVSKYLVKHNGIMEGEKSYFTSRNLKKPKELLNAKEINQFVAVLSPKSITFNERFQNEYVQLNYTQYNLQGQMF